MAHLASHIQNNEVRFLPEFFDSRSNWTDFRVELFAMACSNAAAELLGERDGFLHSISPGRLAGDRMGVVPASGFSFSAQQIWKVIKENKDFTSRMHIIYNTHTFSTAVANFELDNETVVKIMIHMKDRFAVVFIYDSDSMPRVWTGNEDIRSITKDARTASLKLLLTMAAIRLDEKPDNIENVLVSSLVDRTVTVSSSQNRKLGPPTDPLASSSWEEVSSKDTLITPVQCKSLSRQFKAETEYSVTQAISAQEAHKRSNNWLPPPWAIMAMIVLGFNEFMMLLKNPLYLMVLFVAFLLSKALWVQMDITGQFQHDAVMVNSDFLGHSTRTKLWCFSCHPLFCFFLSVSLPQFLYLSNPNFSLSDLISLLAAISRTPSRNASPNSLASSPARSNVFWLFKSSGRRYLFFFLFFMQDMKIFLFVIYIIPLRTFEGDLSAPVVITVWAVGSADGSALAKVGSISQRNCTWAWVSSCYFIPQMETLLILSNLRRNSPLQRSNLAAFVKHFPRYGLHQSQGHIPNSHVALIKLYMAMIRAFRTRVSACREATLQEAVETGPVQGFGKRLSSILATYLSEKFDSGLIMFIVSVLWACTVSSSDFILYVLISLMHHRYDMEAIYFDERVRNSKRQLLESKALDFVYPAYSAMLGHLRYKALEDFQVRLEQLLNKGEGFASSVRTCAQSSMLEFEKGCADVAIQQANWDASKVREKLRRDIDAHASSVRSAKLAELNSNYEKKLSSSLSGPVEALLETGAKDTWASIRKLLNHETEVAVSEFSTAVANFELDNETVAKMKQHLKDYARNVVETKAREEAGKIMIHMKDRDSMPRVWTGNEDIRSITKDARTASLKLLSTMAAIRLDEKPDNIENVLVSSLVDGTVTVSSSQNRKLGPSTDPLASSSWEEVSSKDTLITPVQCKSLWRQFKAETEYSITQAISAQEAHKQTNNWLPSPWAIMAMIVLGFNEFMMFLKNPLYLMVLFVAFLLSKALWVHMGITGQFQHGALSGILSISSRFLPTVMNLLRKLAEEAQGNQTPEAQRRPVSLSSQSYRNETPQPNPVTSSFPESSVSSNISSSDTGMEYSSLPLRQRRTTNVEEVESS
ncbi:unnamed protein product [Malus baccata var. baccata]